MTSLLMGPRQEVAAGVDGQQSPTRPTVGGCGLALPNQRRAMHNRVKVSRPVVAKTARRGGPRTTVGEK